MAQSKTLKRSKFFRMIDYKLVFITLTLSSAQLHSDKEIKQKLLQPFLRIMRKRWHCINYVWKAEAQDNGNIHFHITTHQYIHWEEIRTVWNTLQESLGYITRSDSDNPNSTDVHAVYKKKNVAAYVSGEMCKKDIYKKDIESKNWSEHYYMDLCNITGCDLITKKEVRIKRGIEGKIYDCNVELKSICATARMHIELSEDLCKIESDGNKIIQQDFFKIYTYKEINGTLPELRKIIDTFIRKAYCNS